MIHPRDNEGVFDSSLPDYENELREISRLGDQQCKDGHVSFEVAVMDDGTPYPIVTGLPKEPRSDTAIVYSTAWLTSTKGHNRHTLHRMMRHGYPTVMIGPEGQLRNRDQNFLGRLLDARHMSLTRTSFNMNRVLDKKLNNMDVRGEEIITLGESRGAMTGFGFDTEEYSGDRRARYSDLTAPCFARKPLLEEADDIAAQLLSEIKTLGKLGVDLFSNKMLRQKSGTLHKDPEYYLKEVIKAWNLMNGQAGDLARAGRPDTPMHIRVFESDGWSQANDWEILFENRPQVKIERATGFHLDIAEPTTLGRISARLQNLAEQRGFDGSFEQVNFDAVIEAGETVSRPDRKITVPFIGKRAVRSAAAA